MSVHMVTRGQQSAARMEEAKVFDPLKRRRMSKTSSAEEEEEDGRHLRLEENRQSLRGKSSR